MLDFVKVSECDLEGRELMSGQKNLTSLDMDFVSGLPLFN